MSGTGSWNKVSSNYKSRLLQVNCSHRKMFEVVLLQLLKMLRSLEVGPVDIIYTISCKVLQEFEPIKALAHQKCVGAIWCQCWVVGDTSVIQPPRRWTVEVSTSEADASTSSRMVNTRASQEHNRHNRHVVLIVLMENCTYGTTHASSSCFSVKFPKSTTDLSTSRCCVCSRGSPNAGANEGYVMLCPCTDWWATCPQLFVGAETVHAMRAKWAEWGCVATRPWAHGEKGHHRGPCSVEARSQNPRETMGKTMRKTGVSKAMLYASISCGNGAVPKMRIIFNQRWHLLKFGVWVTTNWHVQGRWYIMIYIYDMNTYDII